MFKLTYDLILISYFIATAYSFADSDIADVSDFQNCVCVPYWQCKEDYSGLVEDGMNIIDIRSSQTIVDRTPPCTGDYDVCCQVECGKRRSRSTEGVARRDEVFGFRILGEKNEADFAEFPWMLGILAENVYRCGASLIHPQVAMTAAHCMLGGGPFKIRAGEYNWLKHNEPIPHQDRMSQKIIIHPYYHAASLRNDIALIILETPFKLTENVGVTCLPLQGLQFDNLKCVATGWGKNSYKKGTYQPTLKKVDLPVVARDRCLRSLQEARLGPFFSLHQSFICAGGENNKDTCKGDGGSPLMCPVIGQPGRYQQVGIVSWGLTCGIQSTPGVYVNIALFRDWIDFTMQSLGFDIKVYDLRK